MALIPSILVALSDSVEWMPSLDCSESSGMSTTLTQSALDYAIAGSAIALGEGEVVVLATFTFLKGSTIGSVCQLDFFGLRLCDARMAAFCWRHLVLIDSIYIGIDKCDCMVFY